MSGSLTSCEGIQLSKVLNCSTLHVKGLFFLHLKMWMNVSCKLTTASRRAPTALDPIPALAFLDLHLDRIQ